MTTYVFKERIKAYSTTVGTGNITLGGAVEGYQPFSVIGNGNQTFYSMTDGVDWEVGRGTYIASPPSLTRDEIYESSNSNNIVNWTSNLKNIASVVPADLTLSATAPASSISSDLVVWKNFKKELDSGVVKGTPLSNSGAGGIVSTFSLAYTTPNAYLGGILESDGDVHFVPFSAAVGQKINAVGTVSTYSMTFTTTQAYWGGIILGGGNIVLVPYTSVRGQRIPPNQIPVTYSLAYTSAAASGAYSGGVLGTDDQVYFVPRNAALGLKSTASATTTYSLAYTVANAYAGGVLAPNGEIHFIPLSAVVGQKISTAGSASTYSLAYTTTDAYMGGVISPKGEIHFIPRSARVGQKYNPSTNTASTYSLIYTTSFAYAGGVLAPNGDIHFIPLNATVGQKVSVDGVVSTYTLAYTTSDAYAGGVLSTNGEIIFIPLNATVGQKISLGTPFNVGFGVSTFLNKF